MLRRHLLHGLPLLAIGLPLATRLAVSGARAQETAAGYPDKPVTVIVPFDDVLLLGSTLSGIQLSDTTQVDFSTALRAPQAAAWQLYPVPATDRLHVNAPEPLRTVVVYDALGATVALASTAWAQGKYPDRPVKVIVALPAGGSADMIARTVGQKLASALGQPFVVENKPGAGNNLGVEAVVNAPPDGYTMLLVNPANGINATLYKDLKFNFIRDIAPVAGLVRTPNVMEVTPSLPVKNVAEFIAYCKANPGKINMASSGSGTSVHLSGELFKSMTGCNMVHVPYKGAGPALNDLLGGQVSMSFTDVLTALPHIKAGKLRPLAVTSLQRNPLYPDTPTIAETGIKGYEALSWSGLSAIKGTPKPIVDKLEATMKKIMASPEIRQRLESVGFVVPTQGGDVYTKFVKSEIDLWTRVIKTAGIKAE